MERQVENLATIFSAVMTKLVAKIDRIAAELRQQISEVKQDIMRWVLVVGTALGLFQAGLAVILRLLP